MRLVQLIRRVSGPVLLMGVLLAAPAVAQPVQVSVTDDRYEPVLVTIPAGGSVEWRHAGQNLHTVTSQPGAPRSFDSHPDCDGSSPNAQTCMDRGDTFSFTFTVAGDYPYYCKVHGQASPAPDPALGAADQPCGMCGLVRVTGSAPTAEPTPRSTPAPTATPRATRSPPAGETPTPTPTVTPELASPDATPSATPRTTPRPTPRPTPDAEDDLSAPVPGDDDGTAPRAAAVVLAVLALGGAGALAWRSLLRVR